jgi:integrase
MQKAAEKGAVLDLWEVPTEIVFVRVLKSKTGAVREVACDCATLLRGWRKLQGECASRALTDLDLVFSVPTKHGETPAFSHSSLNKYWRKIIESLGDRLKGPELSSNQYTPYSLRHSRAVHLIDHGVGVYEAAKMLGHSVQTFESFYAPYLSRKSGAGAVASLRKVD